MGGFIQQRSAGVEGDAFSFVFGRWMRKAVMTNGFESRGQHVPQVTPNKLSSFDNLGLVNTTVLSIFPRECDMGVGDRAYA